MSSSSSLESEEIQRGLNEIIDGVVAEVKLTGQDLASLVGVPEQALASSSSSSSEAESILSSSELTEEILSDEEEEVRQAQPSRGYEFVQRLSKRSKLYRRYGFKFVCCREYTGEVAGKPVTVPLGFLSDGVTRGYSGAGEREWLLHDWLYATKGRLSQNSKIPILNRLEADSVFLTFPQFHRWLAVRVFAKNYWGAQAIEFGRRIQPKLVQYN